MGPEKQHFPADSGSKHTVGTNLMAELSQI